MSSLKIINTDKITEENVSSFIPRTSLQIDEIREDVLKIINEVKLRKDKALLEFTKRYDSIELKGSEIQVSEEEFNESYEKIDVKLLEALRFAKKNLIKFHKAQLREEWSIEIEKGVTAGQIFRSIDSIGIYIPGGRASYPSTVLMAAVPANIAGVENIIICSPPQKNGKIAPEILVAAKECEINKIYKVGGAQAIAAMAYGTETIPKVQKVVGPGNKWVNAAKQILSDVIAIDSPAGPSEILIIADEYAKSEFVIADFISQLEHDPDNVGIIVTPSSELIKKVLDNIDIYIQNSERREIIKAAAFKNSLIIKANDIDDCVKISNIIAPEHIEVLIKNPRTILNKINNAGAIFIGPYSPVPIGDYSAGTNHILPTGGGAKKYSGLSVYDFLKIINVLECNKNGLKTLSESAFRIAEFEGLIAHKKSIEKRLKDKN